MNKIRGYFSMNPRPLKHLIRNIFGVTYCMMTLSVLMVIFGYGQGTRECQTTITTPITIAIVSGFSLPFGALKLNFDGAIRCPIATIGFYAAWPHWLWVPGHLLPTCSDLYCWVSLWEGLRCVVLQFQASWLWIEGNSLVIISMLTDPKSTYCLTSPLVQDFLGSRWTGLAFKFSHIARIRNRMAYQAATFAFNDSFHFDVMHSMPVTVTDSEYGLFSYKN